MKRKLITFCVYLAMVSTAFGCTFINNGEEVSSENTVDLFGGMAVDNTSEPASEINSEEPESLLTSEGSVFEAFLNNESDAFASAGLVSKVDAFYGSLNDLLEEEKNQIENEFYFENLSLDTVEYAEIDCGKDGNKELAIAATYVSDYDTYINYWILKPDDDGNMTILSSDFTYYRYDTSITSYGVITSGGSTSAASSASSISVVTADGKKELVYSCEATLCLPEAVIDKYMLPESLWDEVESSDYYFEENYDCYCYRIPNGYDDEGFTTYDYYYEFYSYEDQAVVLPDADYVKWGEANGLHFLEEGEMDEMIENMFSQYGLTVDERFSPMIEWKQLDI